MSSKTNQYIYRISQIGMVLAAIAMILIIYRVRTKGPELPQEEEVLVEEESYPYANHPHLMTVESLRAVLGDDRYKVIDFRKEQQYTDGHIPGSIRLYRTDIQDATYEYGGMAAKREAMEDLLGESGIRPTDKVVIYDDKGEVDAARLWWLMMRYGHDAVMLLDGGLTAWKNANFEISTDASEWAEVDYQFPAEGNETLCAQMPEVEQAVKSENIRLLDTRSTVEYTGEEMKKGAYRAGHIPTSIHIDYAEAIDYGNTFQFKSPEELREIYEAKGIVPNDSIIVYCQSGVRSAHTTFVLRELLGYKKVCNYDGSWIEWSFHEELAIE